MEQNTENAIVKVEESEKAYTIVGVKNPEEFFMKSDNFKPILEFAEKRAHGLVADATTKEGQKLIKETARKIKGLVNDIDAAHDAVVKELKAKPKIIDAVRKAVKDELLVYRDDVLAPLKEIEERQAQIVEIQNLPAQGIGCDSVAIKELLARLDEESKKDWKESKEDAEESIAEAKRQLTDMLARQEKAEADAREAEEYRRRKEEMDRIEKERMEAELKKAKEAEEKAKKEAEDAKRKADEAEKAKARAEEAKAKAEASVPDWKKADAKVDENRLFPEDETERKRRCNNEALDALEKIVGNRDKAKEIVCAIAKERIPHVYIDYRK